VILVQGSAATDVPFHLQVIQNNKVYATISFPVKITPVEQFYRWINLRGVPDLDPGRNGAPIGTVARATAVGVPPNRPDSLTSNKHFVFMHGYNVDEDSARGWGSEIFKRMYQLGMKAKFTMVTWRGNKSQVGGVTPDYWQNVTNAFITAPHLKTALDSLPGTKLLTAHSLGNMVACSAIKDHGLAVEQYFMLDAAVPLEAIDESADSRATMRHPEWAEYDQTLNGQTCASTGPATGTSSSFSQTMREKHSLGRDALGTYRTPQITIRPARRFFKIVMGLSLARAGCAPGCSKNYPKDGPTV
jgi:hypothetical protein